MGGLCQEVFSKNLVFFLEMVFYGGTVRCSGEQPKGAGHRGRCPLQQSKRLQNPETIHPQKINNLYFSPSCNPVSCRRGQRPRCPVEQFGILHCFQPNILDAPHPSPPPHRCRQAKNPNHKIPHPRPPVSKSKNKSPTSPHPRHTPVRKNLTNPPIYAIINYVLPYNIMYRNPHKKQG